MSLQDDYYELHESLDSKWQKDALDRIWDVFVEMEAEQEELLAIRGSVRRLIELTFKDREDGDQPL